jgi:hypothetical protein
MKGETSYIKYHEIPLNPPIDWWLPSSHHGNQKSPIDDFSNYGI